MGEVQKGDGGGGLSLSHFVFFLFKVQFGSPRGGTEMFKNFKKKKKSEVQFLVEATEREENINSDTCRNPQNKE